MTEIMNNTILDSFINAKGVTDKLVNPSLTSVTQQMRDVNKALDENVFKGPAADGCRSGIEKLVDKMENVVIYNYNGISNLLQVLHDNYKKQDENAKSIVLIAFNREGKMSATYQSNGDLFIDPTTGIVFPIEKGKGNIDFTTLTATQGSGSGLHKGVDIVCPMGTPIYASSDGVITKTTTGGRDDVTWNDAGYGNYVRLAGQFGGRAYDFITGHMSKIVVKQGDTVKAGQLIGYSGSSGRSNTPHVHWEAIPGHNQQYTGTYTSTGMATIMPSIRNYV